MKVAPAMMSALAVASLMALTWAEAVPVSNAAWKLREQIEERVRGGMVMIGKLADKYKELAGQKGMPKLDAGKYALAFKLMNAVASLPWDDMTLLAQEDIVGKDLEMELSIFTIHADQAQSKVDVKLESLMKLAAELPSDNTIAEDVIEAIKYLDGNITFLNRLSVEPESQVSEQHEYLVPT